MTGVQTCALPIYNFFRLVMMLVIYPTRWFWKAIGWVPFSKKIYGEFCSSFVDEVLWQVGIDVLPDEFHGYTAPVDLLRTIEAGTYRQAFL